MSIKIFFQCQYTHKIILSLQKIAICLMAFIHPLNVRNRQDCTIVSIFWMRLTVSLIVVDLYKHICEIFMCKIFSIDQFRVEPQDPLSMIISVTLIIDTDVLI